MSERKNCAFYSEWQDMNATVPCCDIYGIGNCKCSDCKKYVSENDRVVVVRCKDCKYREKSSHSDRRDFCKKHTTWEYTDYVNPTDYCSKGERKETNDSN